MSEPERNILSNANPSPDFVPPAALEVPSEEPAGEQQETAPANGEDKTKDTDYYFDRTPLEAKVAWGDGKSIVVIYSKPEAQDHVDYEALVQRRTIISAEGAEDDSDAEEANVEFFDRTVQGAEKRRDGKKEPIKFYSKEECLGWEPEVKTLFVKAMGQSNFKVLVSEENEDAGLTTGDTPLEVEQRIGDEDNPDFVIIYKMKPTPKKQRDHFTSGVKPKDKNKRSKVIRTTKMSLIEKGMGIFSENFISVRGGRLERGAFKEEWRDDYIGQIDGAFQMLVVDSLVTFTGTPPKL